MIYELSKKQGGDIDRGKWRNIRIEIGPVFHPDVKRHSHFNITHSCASSTPTKSWSLHQQPPQRAFLLLPRPSHQQPPQWGFLLLPRPSPPLRPHPIPYWFTKLVQSHNRYQLHQAPVNPTSLPVTKRPVVVTEPSPVALDPKGRLFQALFVWLFILCYVLLLIWAILPSP